MRKKVSKKTKATKTTVSGDAHVGFCIDMSGSMGSCRGATISGFNEWLGSAKGLSDAGSTRLTVMLFNTQTRKLAWDATALGEVGGLNEALYRPDECTPLYDSLAALILAMDHKVGPKPTKSPLVFVMTDGLENSSREYTRERVFEMIRERTARGWTFGYLGANQDAWAVGTSIGVQPGNTASYAGDPVGTRAAYAGMAMATMAVSDSGYKQSFNLFNPSQPADLGPENKMSSVTDLAKRLGVSSRTIRKEVASGSLPASKIGSRYRVSEEDLLAYLKRTSGTS